MRRLLYIFIPIILLLGSCGLQRTDLFHIAGSSLRVYSYDPVNTGLPIPTNAIVTVAFSEILDTWSVENAFSIEFDGQTYTSEHGWFEWFAWDHAFGFHFDPDHSGGPDDPYPLGIDITVRIDGSVRDREGFYLTESLEWTFTTSAGEDSTAPTVLSWAPTYSEDISVQAHLEILFSEPMIRSTLAAGFVLACSDPQDIRTIDNGFFVWSDDNTRVKYYLKEQLLIGKDYVAYMNIPGAIPKDLAGNELVSGDRTHTYFSTWADSIKIVVDPNQVPSDLTDFPVYIDLSEMPAAFFSDVLPTGADIAIISGDRKQVLSRELVYIDTGGGGQGELWFKAPKLSSSADTAFYLLYNNPLGGMSNSPDVWSNGFAGVYHLNGVFDDSSPYGRHGTEFQSSPVPGIFGEARFFDGIDDYFMLTYPDIINSAGTLSMWISPQDWMGERTMFDATMGDKWFFLDLHLSVPFEYLRFSIKDNLDYVYEATKDVTVFPVGPWHHVAGVWGYRDTPSAIVSTPAARLYFDSGFEAQSANPLSVKPPLFSPYVGHTRSYYETIGMFFGAIDEVRISNTQRSPGWIAAEYNNQIAPYVGGFFKDIVLEP